MSEDDPGYGILKALGDAPDGLTKDNIAAVLCIRNSIESLKQLEQDILQGRITAKFKGNRDETLKIEMFEFKEDYA